jgi:hypothetical protein
MSQSGSHLSVSEQSVAACAEAAGKVGYPMLWRQASLAVELCQRAAEMAGPTLPGSYRPCSRAGNDRRVRRPSATA